MKKIILPICAVLISTNAFAYLVQERCDEEYPFEISSGNACEELCPNRYTEWTGGTSYSSYSCIRKDSTETLKNNLDPCDIMLINSREEAINCVKDAIQKRKDGIYLDRDYPEVIRMCDSDPNYYVWDDNPAGEYWCYMKCPTEYPLQGIVGDCYSCDIESEIMLDDRRDDIDEFKLDEKCKNRIIVYGNSIKNRISDVDTISKVQSLIDSGFNINEEYHGLNVLSWNLLLNDNPELIKFLLEKGSILSAYVLRFAVKYDTSRENLEVLLKNAKSKDMTFFQYHGLVNGEYVGNDWNINLSRYARLKGREDEIVDLIVKYEKLHKISK